LESTHDCLPQCLAPGDNLSRSRPRSGCIIGKAGFHLLISSSTGLLLRSLSRRFSFQLFGFFLAAPRHSFDSQVPFGLMPHFPPSGDATSCTRSSPSMADDDNTSDAGSLQRSGDRSEPTCMHILQSILIPLKPLDSKHLYVPKTTSQ
jgi:hypothetical protein